MKFSANFQKFSAIGQKFLANLHYLGSTRYVVFDNKPSCRFMNFSADVQKNLADV